MSFTAPTVREAGVPAWIEEHVQYSDGRDPLGFDTISTDRILPRLLPGIVANSRRARYLSFDLFLLDEFHRRRAGTTQSALGDFIRRAEFEFACAVELCPRPNCGPNAIAMIGERAASREMSGLPPTVARHHSVSTTASGGYGQLGYRSVLIATGAVAQQGEVVDGARLSFDRLVSDRARGIAETLRQRIQQTSYWQHLGGEDPVPTQALRELSEAACLCRLPECDDERTALVSLLFTPGSGSQLEARDAARRRAALGLVLHCIDSDPRAARDTSALRRVMWDLRRRGFDQTVFGQTVSGWAALVAKEYLAAAVSTAWHAANLIGRTGPVDGWGTTEYFAAASQELHSADDVLGARVDGPDQLTAEFADAIRQATSDIHPDDVLADARKDGSLAAAIGALLVLRGRVPADPDASWLDVSGLDGWAQSGLGSAMRRLDQHLEGNPTLGATAEWLMRTFVLLPHERIATAKLGQYDPPFHTFRFRHEQGRLRFFRLRDISAAGVGAPRFSALCSLGEDLGWWERTDYGGRLTILGQAFLATAFT